MKTYLGIEVDQKDLPQIFGNNSDPYSDFTTDVFEFKVDKNKEGKRFVGLTCILELSYGPKHKEFTQCKPI